MKNHVSGKSRIGLLVSMTAAIAASAVVAWFYFGRVQEPSSGGAAPAALPDFQATRTKAEAGDAEAAQLLAEIYVEGKQVRQDYYEAAYWYRKAADKGIVKAQYNLAELYDIGQGIARDQHQAASWYLKAAEQGDVNAQYTLAGMYGVGRAVALDPKEALKWYHRAAEQGDELARYNLAERYERGRDVIQDDVEAYKWHSLAADKGLADAAQGRDRVKRRLTPELLAEARRRIQEFKAKHGD